MEKNIQRLPQPDIWGGIECTINRVGDNFFDQLEYSGHYGRESDYDQFGKLGISKMRFPILWEKHEPVKDMEISWDWVASRLQKLKENNITPIAGLLHHGSGPSYTNLADPKFPELFVAYAEKVAKQFPFLEYYTPINEPLTTARFSGLYGLWYPHRRNAGIFAKMILNQAKATVLAMQAIRKINPDAKLVQTEDLGKIYSTSVLKYQANFENVRRWLTFDLLCGRVNKKHLMWRYFTKRLGIHESALQFFLDNQCPPDVLGVNYYVTSERFLDHRISDYPNWKVGGNGKHKYVDVDAIRVEHEHRAGLGILLQEAWDRYKIPIAITEVQLNCYREHQLRWFQHVYNSCVKMHNKGVDICAVTAWSMLGAYGWNKLVTIPNGDYESGVFDMRTGEPRPTALFRLIQSITNKQQPSIAVSEGPGWWEMNTRFLKSKKLIEPGTFSSSAKPPILILGKTGTLGNAFSRLCDERGLSYRITSRDECDIANPDLIRRAIDKYKPWAIVNAAGYVRVDDAESDADRCFRENVIGPKHIAAICREKGIRLATFSSDLVFNGEKKDPYLESDSVFPLNVYGCSKAEGEQAVLNEYKEALIIRTSAFFGPWDKYNFVYDALQTLQSNQQFVAIRDVQISPTYVPDLVNATLDLLIDDEKAIWHIANSGSTTWADFAKEVAKRGGCSTRLVQSKNLDEMEFVAPRPNYSVLHTEKGIVLPSLDNALERYFSEKCIA